MWGWGFLLSLWAVVSFAATSPITIKAKKEGWTFHFKPGQKKSCGLKKPAEPELLTSLPYEQPIPVAQIPSKYDLRSKISQIEDQGDCGSCWSFSLIATMRDAWILAGQDPGRLSQQYLVDCATNQWGCNGGYFNAASWLMVPRGAPSLVSYPYLARRGLCRRNLRFVSSITSWYYLGAAYRSPSIEEIQRAILSYGPVSVTVAADDYFMAYESGIYNACSSQSVNHMVNIVGWDNSQKYWIMRNSWGKSWGENGYMRIKYLGVDARRCNAIGEHAAFMKIMASEVPKEDEKKK